MTATTFRADPDRLQAERRRVVMSRHDLAVAAGVSTSVVEAIEAGRYKTTQPKTIRALASALGIEPAELLTDA